jgi:hypothetical protein
MKMLFRAAFSLLLVAGSVAVQAASAPPEQAASSRKAATMTVSFGGVGYLHRWSKAAQHEFTPQPDADLTKWQDMVTINVHDAARNGDQLAQVANAVVSNYQKVGKILRTDSKPRTADRPAEHLVVAVLGTAGFLEAAFARFYLNDGVGYVVVYSHRVYGTAAGPAMSEWLKANGPQIEKTLMGWTGAPGVAALKALPQSQ